MDDKQQDTKERLIIAGCKEFANMGYSRARVREICHNANANLASVNYHFGGKSKLYIAVLEYLHKQTEEHWGDVNTTRNLGEEEAMKEFESRFNHFFDTIIADNELQNLKSRLLYRELTEPSEMFDEVFETFCVPRMNYLENLLSGLVKKDYTGDELKVLVFSVTAQFAFYANSRTLIKRLTKNENFIAENREKIAKRIMGVLK